MQVHISKYKRFIGPYQVAELLFCWVPKKISKYGIEEFPDWVTSVGKFFAYGFSGKKTWFNRLLLWIDTKRPTQHTSIKIHPYDTWNMYQTLATIILPMLKQLRDTKQGSPDVDDIDVPETLKSSNTHVKWEYVVNEMIFAFEHLVDQSWEAQFKTGQFDMRTQPISFKDDGTPMLYEMVAGPNHTYHVDDDALQAIWKRIDNGLCLFGKYYRCLWD